MKITKANRRNIVFCALAILILAVCFILIAHFSGFQHEPKEFRTMLKTLLFVVILDLLIWEPIRFIVLAIDHATWPSMDMSYESDVGNKPTLFAYLKTRLKSRRSEVLITDEHRNEALNQKYKRISTDLILYGSFFLTLLLIILSSQDQSLYYATNMMNRLFRLDTPTTMGLSGINFQYEIYTFFSLTLVEAFNVNNSDYGYNGWYAMEQWKMMGAIRLRQLRTPSKNVGTDKLKWDNKTYAPEWKLPYKRLHYRDRFWRVFDPFTPMDVEPSFINGLLLNFDHLGDLMLYPELGGYMALMMRTQVSNRMQVKYLHAYKWLDRKTVALFMDFSMYNADANAFTILTLRVENSPFGTQLTNVQVDCIRILSGGDHLTSYQTILLAIYFILVLQFIRVLGKNLWYDPASIKQLWNLVDLCIFLLNVFLLILYCVRELLTNGILETVQTSTMEQYLGVQRPLQLHRLIDITLGLLITITTLRLWKVLQFASVFQHFSQTVFSAWKATISLGVAIIVILMGLGIALAVPNGNNALVCRHVVHAIITCLWYSTGYSEGINPNDFFHGGVIFGVLIFLTLVFLLGIILLNVFASVIYDYLINTGKILKEKGKTEKISFWQFLQVEYGELVRRYLFCFFKPKKYYRHKRTVAENVAMELDRLEYNELLRSRGRYYKPKRRLTDEEQQADYMRRVHRVISLNAVLEVQLDLLERYLFGDEYGNISTPPGSDADTDITKWGKPNLRK
ncbi:polycystic kidney disease protein 1-like 3 [Drosophila serrata]|uniref:polycystic kidney disease protein 1-like 3 n=1 Tax=Drosophila serrata TaxID=7274 RepID=UPI000A1D1990|nr:polycystic kidney disease protein 1-like 3 [Drosophila serrata]KAH8360598.1 hypothetical protein KR200_009798 [Drosophila serrata]